jgi:hypothetical protein
MLVTIRAYSLAVLGLSSWRAWVVHEAVEQRRNGRRGRSLAHQGLVLGRVLAAMVLRSQRLGREPSLRWVCGLDGDLADFNQ